jgi:hypothetical protein
MSARNDSTTKGAATGRSRLSIDDRNAADAKQLDRSVDAAIVDLESAVSNASAAAAGIGSMIETGATIEIDGIRAMLADARTLAAGAAKLLDDASATADRLDREGSDR